MAVFGGGAQRESLRCLFSAAASSPGEPGAAAEEEAEEEGEGGERAETGLIPLLPLPPNSEKRLRCGVLGAATFGALRITDSSLPPASRARAKCSRFGRRCPRETPPSCAANSTLITCPPVYSPALTRVWPNHSASAYVQRKAALASPNTAPCIAAASAPALSGSASARE